MNETYIGIIPARYQSSRFPGKPLCNILGKSMIQRVYESVCKWDKWKEVYVATDSDKILDFCKKFDIPCLMTKDYHTDCLDRASEAVEILEKQDKGANKYIIIQGDEPLFNIDTLNVSLDKDVINFYTEVHDMSDLDDPNSVKVVISENKKALYFSRYTIPYHNEKTLRGPGNFICFKQIGVYVFTSYMLKKYTELPMSYLERNEGIGLLRLLENDIDVHMRYTKHDSISVDTPSDRDRIIKIIKDYYSNSGCSISDDGQVINCEGDKI